MRENSTRFHWKLIALVLSIFFMANATYAQPQVCGMTGSGQKCSPNSFGAKRACEQVHFVVDRTIPSGYTTIGKYEWYVNNVLQKVSNDYNDYNLVWVIKDENTVVYCNVFYRNGSGPLSGAVKSTEFTVWQDYPELVLNGPSTVDLGSTTPQNYSLTPGSGTCIGCYALPGSAYTVSWTPIANWTQTAISGNGQAVTLTPDGSTGGALTAYATLTACPYTFDITKNVTRPIPPISFANGNSTLVCGSSENFSVNGVPGATSYTYTLTGDANGSFTANGLRTLTTAATTVNISLTSTHGFFTLKVNANFSGGASTGEASHSFKYGPPAEWAAIASVPPRDWDCYQTFTMYTFEVTNPEPGSSYQWSLFTPTSGSPIPVPSPSYVFYQPGGYGIVVEPYNACGSGVYSYTELGINVTNDPLPWCGSFRKATAPDRVKAKGTVAGLNRNLVAQSGYRVFPNPARTSITVNSVHKAIAEIKIYDVQGRLKKQLKLNNVLNVPLAVNDLAAGVYIIAISDGKTVERSKISIQR